MKTTKLIVGITSIVLTFLIMFQSCAATLGDALVDEGGTSGFSGMLVAICMLIAGIVAIAARNSRGGGIFCTVLYAFAGLVGISMHGMFGDLMIWGGLCFVFALIFLISVVRQKKTNSLNMADQSEKEERK